MKGQEPDCFLAKSDNPTASHRLNVQTRNKGEVVGHITRNYCHIPGLAACLGPSPRASQSIVTPNLVATNADPLGATGIASVDHCGAPEIRDGLLYIPVEVYPSGPYTNQHIAAINASDLSFSTSFDVSAQGHEVSAIAFNPVDGLMYVTDYTSGGVIYKYDPASSFAYQGSLTLSDTPARMQGITFFQGKMYVSTDTIPSAPQIRRYSLAGKFEGRAFFPPSTSPVAEGLSHTDDALLWLLDNSGTEFVYKLRRSTAAQAGWLNLGGAGQAKIAGVSRFTSWTMGCSVVPKSNTANSAILSYTQDETANTSRATLAFRDTTPDAFGVWTSDDTWLMDTLSDPALNIEYRLHHVQNGTTNRKIYRNGSGTTDAGVAQKPSGASAVVLYIGAEDLSLNERMTGSINFVYLRDGELSADWIAAEDKSWRTPDSFYTIAEA